MKTSGLTTELMMISPLDICKNVSWLEKTIKAYLNGHTCSSIVTQISTKWLSKTKLIPLPIILTYLQYWFCFNRWRVGKASNFRVPCILISNHHNMLIYHHNKSNNLLFKSSTFAYENSNRHKLIYAMFQHFFSGKEWVISYSISMK